MSMKFETCPVCRVGTASEVVIGRVDVKVPEGKVSIEGDRLMRCDAPACHEEYYTDDQARERSEKIAAARRKLRDEKRILQPEDIVRIRTKYQLTQRRLEQLLGLGPKTVVRWEKGYQMPSVAADNLLRVIDRDPSVLAYLAEIRTQKPMAM
jgi:putative zinc finger/helix-turn-helix YgiT family protein